MSNAGSTLVDGVVAAYPAMSQFYASDWYVAEARNEGYFVLTGCAVSASGTAGKIDLSAGTIFAATTEVTITAVTAFATTITSIADATNPKWVAVEIDPTAPTAAVTFNQGTAAANPSKPTPSSARVVVAWLYVPANATAVDALLSTANGKAKIIDARQLVANHGQRLFYYDGGLTSLTNPTSLTTLLTAAPPIPAYSNSLGDTLRITGSGLYKNTQNNSTIQFNLGLPGVNWFDYTTATLNLDATNSRRWVLDVTATFYVIGGSASVLLEGMFFITAPNASTNAIPISLGGGASGDGALLSGAASATWATTSAQTLDFKAKVNTSSSTSFIALRGFTVLKQAA